MAHTPLGSSVLLGDCEVLGDRRSQRRCEPSRVQVCAARDWQRHLLQRPDVEEGSGRLPRPSEGCNTSLPKDLQYVSCVEEFPMNNLRLWAHDATHLSHPDGMQVLTDLICKAIRILSVVEPALPARETCPVSSGLSEVRGLSPIPVSSGQFDVLAAPQKTPKNPASLARSKVTQPRAGVSRQPKTPRKSAAGVEEATSPTSSWQPRVVVKRLKTEVAVPSRPAVNTVTTQPQDQPMQTDDVPVSPTPAVCKEAKVTAQLVEPEVKRASAIAATAATADPSAVQLKTENAVPSQPSVNTVTTQSQDQKKTTDDIPVSPTSAVPKDAKVTVQLVEPAVKRTSSIAATAEKTTTWADKVKSPPTSSWPKVPLTSDWNPYIVVKQLKTKKTVRPMVNTASTTVKTGFTIQQNHQVLSDMTMMTSGAGPSKTNATSKTEKVPVKRASCGTSSPVVKVQRLSHEDCKGKAPEAPSAAKQAPVVQLQRLQKDDSGAKFTHLENIVGSFHQGEAIFSAISRGRQCTANALAAIVRHTHVRNVLEWSQEDLNKVLQEDSHARSKSGMVDDSGKSVVVFLKSLSDVRSHINQLAGCGAGNAEFELSSVAVSLTDHKSACKDVSVDVVTVDSESDCDSLREEEHVVVTMESEFESVSEPVSADVVLMEGENESQSERVYDEVTVVGSANETECERMTEMMAGDISESEVEVVSVKVESPTVNALNTNSTGLKAWDTRSSTKGNVPEVGHKRRRTESDPVVSPLPKKNRVANKRKRAEPEIKSTSSSVSQGHYEYHFVDTNHLLEALKYLKENNHYYKDIEINHDWNNVFAKEEENSNQEEASIEEEITCEEKQTEEDSNAITNKSETPDEEEDETLHDRQNHGIYQDSCSMPIDIGQEILDRGFEDIINLAPAEGNNPYMSEVQQVVQQVSVASRKGHSNSTGPKETDNVDSLQDIVRTDDGYRFLRPIRGTPAYWEEYRVLSTSEKKSKAAIKLQNSYGYISKRVRTKPAVIRYARFSETKNPELYCKSLLQLFLPYRKDEDLKPAPFSSFEHFYKNGTVELGDQTVSVMALVNSNRSRYDKETENLEDIKNNMNSTELLQDAWSTLCPEQEVERLESMIELEQGKVEDEGPLPPIPDLSMASKDICHLEKQQNIISRSEGLDLIRSLNEQQLSIFHKIQTWCVEKANGNNPDPLNVFITGGAGTGKSHLIRAIQYEANRLFATTRHHPDNINVLLTAPTGMAAHNLHASTIHSAFSIGINVTLPYLPLGEERLNSLRAKYVDLQIVIIDEISMVSHDLLIYIHNRLRQIKQRGDFSPFANVSIIAVGDFYQLPPVMAKGLYTDNLPVNLWSNFKKAELKTVVRQKDTTFAELLNRLRTRSKGEPMLQDDIEILKSRETGEQSSALHIFPTNTQVSDHNINQLKATCPDSITIEAQDYHYNKKTGKMEKRLTPHTKDNLTCLPRELPLGVSARVMLCKNIDVEDGLVNGVCGTVTHISDIEINGLPEAVYVEFDGVRVGTQRRKKYPSTSAALRKSTRIEPEEERANSKGVKRRQFPLTLAWAVTVHKVQGLTVDNAVVSLNKMFAAGQAYVALSRVTTLDGLIIQEFQEKVIYCNDDVKNALEVMPCFMENNVSKDQQTADVLTLFLLNVQGLHNHVFDLVSCTQSLQPDCIAVTETWLTSESSLHTVDIKGYNFHSQPRSLSYGN
ncbi:hypothetical protein WMY93_034234, partial [Mugilogobius chulae]